MENRMNMEHSPLIDKLRRQMAAAGCDEVPVSVYESHDAHWSVHYASRSYVEAGEDYDDYAPAYLYGVFLYHTNPQRHFDTYVNELANGWDSARGESPLDWIKAKPAVREAWYRVRDLAERAKSERTELLSTPPTAHTPGDH
jgi:hypothetical protein